MQTSFPPSLWTCSRRQWVRCRRVSLHRENLDYRRIFCFKGRVYQRESHSLWLFIFWLCLRHVLWKGSRKNSLNFIELSIFRCPLALRCSSIFQHVLYAVFQGYSWLSLPLAPSPNPNTFLFSLHDLWTLETLQRWTSKRSRFLYPLLRISSFQRSLLVVWRVCIFRRLRLFMPMATALLLWSRRTS